MKTLLFKVALLAFISLVSVKSTFAQSPPFVSFTSPTMGSSVVAGSTLDLGVTIASGVGVSYVTYTADGSFLCVDTAAPYSCPWQVPTAIGVGHTLQARVVDNLGANTYAFSFVGTIADTVAPVVSITNPSNGANLEVGSSVLISANSSDNVGVTSVEFYVDGSLLCTDTSAPYSCVWSVPNTLSSHTLTAKSYDTSSNMSQTSVSVNTVDTVAPSITITTPTSGATLTAGSVVNFSATASDNIGVTSVEFYIDGAFLCFDTVAPYSCDWYIPPQPGSFYTLTARAYDVSFNRTDTSIQVNTLDTVSPVVNFTYPTNGGMIPKNSTITIAATATDNYAVANVKFYVNGVLKCIDTIAPYTCDWFVPKQKNITYTFYAQATDTSRNVGDRTISARSY